MQNGQTINSAKLGQTDVGYADSPATRSQLDQINDRIQRIANDAWVVAERAGHLADNTLGAENKNASSTPLLAAPPVTSSRVHAIGVSLDGLASAIATLELHVARLSTL